LKITNLNIRNYRNLAEIDYAPGTGLNIIAGHNGQGKTNLLEALFVLATGYSFRSGNYRNLLAYEKSSFLVNSNYSFAGRNIESQLDYNTDKVKFIINHKKASHRSTDRLRVVLFTPDDLYIVKGHPGRRRDFIDFMLKQISPEYYLNLDNYTKTLKKRNFLLKQDQTNTRTFAILNQLFVEKAAQVIFVRINFVNLLAEMVNNLYQVIDNNRSQIKIKYAVSFPIDSAKITLDILYQALEQNLKLSAEQEKIRKTTVLGPHVDDLNIYHSEKLARYFSSQGQQRTIAVSMKLAELYTFKKIEGYFPVFLLDEVLSELDSDRQIRLLEHLKRADFQSFLTSVSAQPVEGADTVLIENGCLRRS
jgi:DNA replication and repair protein RecF